VRKVWNIRIQLPADDISRNNARRGWREAFHGNVHNLDKAVRPPAEARRNQACLSAPAVKEFAYKTEENSMNDTATGKVAIITAGGSGMGAGAARKLAADGFTVAILSSSGKGEALAAELGGIGVTGSNQSNDDLKRLVDLTMERFGRIDALVNSAGHGPRAPLLDLSDEDWHRGMEVYFLNVVRPTRLVTPIMQAQKSGAIVNISTFAAFEPDPVFPTSGVFRAGLAAYTKLFSDRYAPDNIRMNNVLPGFIDSLPEKSEFKERIPMGRYGTVDEVSELIALLASDRAAYITGQNIRIDGGITRSV
jgi:NAD(P)-dependent dehydrogenase (short-subunit alcohol dehydrogenase family)